MSLRRWLLAILILAGLGVWLGLTFLEHSVSDEPYSLIEDHLYVGAAVKAPPPGTTAVLNLCHQEDSYSVDTHLWEPIDGSQTPSIDWLRRVVMYIDAQRQKGETTYVHCFGGMNRSGMVVTAYLMYEHNWTRDQALAFAQSKRPQIQPNSTLMRFLDDWEQALKQPKAP
jgi:dual specificity protein phosphatase-like protein